MRLYHGSTLAVPRPAIRVPARALDFGPGFYATTSAAQAARWAHRKTRLLGSGTPTVSVYDFDKDTAQARLAVLEFKGPDLAWLEFVSRNRRLEPTGRHHDIVIGPVADDQAIRVIDLFMDGMYSAEQAIERLLPARLVDQVALRTQEALDLCEYVGGEVA